MSGKYWTPWNCILGCKKVSPGCRNCWALSMMKRGAAQNTKYGRDCRGALNANRQEWLGAAVLRDEALNKPLRWKRPRTVAVNWLGDMWRPEVPWGWKAFILSKAIKASQHQYLFLTKRPEELAGDLTSSDLSDNWWFGASVCNQAEADEKIPHLLRIPGQRWLSLEPLLGPVDLLRLFGGTSLEPGPALHALNSAFDWVVVGAETGSGARRCDPAWVLSIVKQCKAAGIPCWVKRAGPPVDYLWTSWPRQKPAGMP